LFFHEFPGQAGFATATRSFSAAAASPERAAWLRRSSSVLLG